MASPRGLTVDPANSGVYHGISRWVRRAFLCGRDSHSGQNFEYRRDWIRDRLRELAGLYSMEIISYSVMANHLHVVVRTLPEQVPLWDDEEIAYRWMQLFPGTRSKPVEEPPDEAEIKSFCKDRGRLADARARLGSLSWFMRSLNEPIARRANQEDGCTGHFWEGRFKSQKLADEGAALACMLLHSSLDGLTQLSPTSHLWSVITNLATAGQVRTGPPPPNRLIYLRS